MKKMILTALVAVASLAANAQVWVGGEVGFSADKSTYDGEKYQNSASVKILPEIGYTLNDKFDIAVLIGLEHGNSRNLDAEPEYETNFNSFVLNPYVRYKFVKSGDFTFFVDGGFGYKYTHWSKVDDNRNSWFIGIKPGIAYNLSEKVSFVAHVGDLSYSFAKQGKDKYNRFGIGANGNDLTIGAYVSF